MIFFVGNDGTVINSFPSPVYQGSVNANTIYLVAPFAANLQVTAAFKLPNGVWTERYLMTQVNEIKGVVNKETGKPYVGWQFSMPNELTQYYGTVTAQFFFYAGQGTVLTASSATSFTVGRGVPEILPEEPSADVYNRIIDKLSIFTQEANNGAFAARSIYQWNSTYTYGAGEIVYYPEAGEYGVFLKSLVSNNNSEPYTEGVLNTGEWQEVVDFNILNELYTLKGDTQEALAQAQANAQAAEQSATVSETSAENAREYFEQAQAQAAAAAGSANSAENWAEVARGYAEFGIKINMDYSSLEELPQPGNSRYIYLIPNGGDTGNGDNTYDEFIWVDDKNAYEKIGTTDIDLSAYETKAEHNESIEIVNNAIGAVNNAIAAVSEALSSETTNREDADSELMEELDTKADTDGDYPDMSVGNATNADNAEVAAKLGTETKGTYAVPIYLNNGTPTACTRTIPVIHLNGEDVSLSPVFYAPISHGSSGNILKSNGNGAPSWTSQGTYSVANGSDQSNICDYVTSIYRNVGGTQWHRIWASGWKECGGIIKVGSKIAAGDNSAQTISFNMGTSSFGSTNYTVSVTASYGSNSPDVKNITGEEISVTGKTLSGMTINYHNRNASAENNTNLQIEYYCCGY